MKIIAVGMNYVAHCHELHADEKLPEEPVIFMKPDSALLKDSKPVFIPDFSQQVDYETELVVRINRLGKNIAPRFASRYYDAVTVGIDFTARDLQRRFREEGKPWELCKGFDSSAAIGDFVPVDRFKDIQNLNFHLDIDGKTVQRGNTADMLFKVDEIIAYVSRFFFFFFDTYSALSAALYSSSKDLPSPGKTAAPTLAVTEYFTYSPTSN